MVYFRIKQLAVGQFIILNTRKPKEVALPTVHSTIGDARAALHDCAAKTMHAEADEAARDGVQTVLQLWTWHDMVLDDESFVAEYNKEMGVANECR